MQAYNYGMEWIYNYLKNNSPVPVFISLAISPAFSGQFAHARRVSCDVFETRENTRYLLNTLTYAWWMNGRIIDIADPDHLPLYRSYWMAENGWTANEREITGAVNSRLIGGTMILWSDNIDSETARARAEHFFLNEELMAVAYRRTAFRPAEAAGRGDHSPVFYSCYGEQLYVAIFNTGRTGRTYRIRLSDYGLENATVAVNLNTGETIRIRNGTVRIRLRSADSAMIRIM